MICTKDCVKCGTTGISWDTQEGECICFYCVHKELTKLRAELENTVPRSRYDVACEQYLDEKKKREELFEKAKLVYAQLEKAGQVYEKFKHLDILLSDENWIDSEDKIHSACREFWLTIKSIAKKEKEYFSDKSKSAGKEGV